MEAQDGLVQMSIFSCAYCGKPLPKGRAHQVYHKECRVKMWRFRQKAMKRLSAMIADIELIIYYSDFPATREIAIEALKQASEALNACAMHARIVRVK